MKSSARLESVVFQLTPTRTRCDLFIIANEKKEKIASGLLNPFLAHLKTAEDQIAKGGYSILLEPDPDNNALWFTKGTVERFVRFVSTPEILERVYTIESEIVQIEEAIAIQANNGIGLSAEEDHHAKHELSNEGNKSTTDTKEEKSIVLYKPGERPAEPTGSMVQEGNSKVQLLKVLETRRNVLQKEQGMAFARAAAAGFDMDHMAPLVSFAECFGASRLMNACNRFMELWKVKHESGQWLEIEEAEAMSNKLEFSTMTASGIMLSNAANKQNELTNDLAFETNGKAGLDTGAEERPQVNNQIPAGQQDFFPGQFLHPMFPPWPTHSPPSALPIFQAYPMQGMPYYQHYSGNGPLNQPPYPPFESSPFRKAHRTGHKRQSMDSRDSNTESETWEGDATKERSQDDLELEQEVSEGRSLRKKAGRSGKKQSGKVVIRNINYITSKRQNSSGSESGSASDSETDKEARDFRADASNVMDKIRSSKRKGSEPKHTNGMNSRDKDDNFNGKDPDSGDWQAFQNCLLRDNSEDNRASNDGMFAKEKDVITKRRQNRVGNDPLDLAGRELVDVRDGRTTGFDKALGHMSHMPRVSHDEALTSRAEGSYNNGRGPTDDAQFTNVNGRKILYRRTADDDFMIDGRENQTNSRISLAVNRFEGAIKNLDGTSSYDMPDESFIVPFRSLSLDQAGADGRSTIRMDSEIPSTHQSSENVEINYEPDALSLVPERGPEKWSTGYDPALDYEMQMRVEDGASLDATTKEVVTSAKPGPKHSEKDRKSKVVLDAIDKKKTGGPIRKGKPSKMTPLEDARARAEKLRTYKADLQKMRKEKEEADLKRIEALKMERQKRIAARASSTSGQSPLPLVQSRKPLPTKVSPVSHRGSKFSDSEAGSSSPLQRSKIRTASLGSGDPRKASKVNKSTDGIQLAGNRLIRSVSSLSDPKKESNSVTPDSKASMARIRRLSEPKTISSHFASSVMARSAEPVSKPKLPNGPENKKISAIMNLDRSKAETLPELKIRTPKGPSNAGQNKLVAKDGATSETADVILSNGKALHSSDVDDNPVIEKTVVMLECEKPSIPVVLPSEEKMGVRNGHYDDHYTGEKVEVASDYAAIRAPPSHVDGVNRDPTPLQLQEQTRSYEVMPIEKGIPEMT
ncbi:hypothetical protein RJ639_024129 [Escallonia herrerae]|uniref:COP1-interacting protein 7 n=1 Tax=Escallonia herrerae TaxID=1293975 RepID=A0AA88V136_9ASTE|nr:hypothetical protein RJ639_024129 [Escallonia herrerae]